MKRQNKLLRDGVPVSLSMEPQLEAAGMDKRKKADKKRILFVSVWAVGIAVASSLIAKALVYLIDLFTNLAFYGEFSFEPSSPNGHGLGLFAAP